MRRSIFTALALMTAATCVQAESFNDGYAGVADDFVARIYDGRAEVTFHENKDEASQDYRTVTFYDNALRLQERDTRQAAHDAEFSGRDIIHPRDTAEVQSFDRALRDDLTVIFNLDCAFNAAGDLTSVSSFPSGGNQDLRSVPQAASLVALCTEAMHTDMM